MQEMSELQVSYDDALARFEKTIEDGRRQWAARLLYSYPRRQDFVRTAEALREDLSTEAVEVNSITEENQETIVKAPGPLVEPVVVPVSDSFCVMTVGLGEPAMISDIQHDDFTEGHVARRRGLSSWASAPIFIEGVCAGTICALETVQPRHWGEEDQLLLEKAAGMISDQVSHWAQDMKHKI